MKLLSTPLLRINRVAGTASLKSSRLGANQLEHAPVNDEKSFSVLNGYSFSFEDGDRKIVLWCSALSGKEKVLVDGELVASGRSYSRETSHTFTVGEDHYSIRMDTESLSRGPIRCTLSKNGKDWKRQKFVFPEVPSLKTEWRKISYWLWMLFFLVFYLALFIGFEAARMYYQLPQLSVLLFLVLLLVFNFGYVAVKVRGRFPEAIIVDEDIT